ncbi:bacteriohemerythrin [Arenimonas sp. GDDSR-1]|uniref:bacteriohemerythrin n=1 Tax=Arenimonas sp. GDDSR-1 TaxID=2950125 RepID=UPI002627681B|nr:bacteriohemerythrin [Arenimonas sp. GDDSR-1]
MQHLTWTSDLNLGIDVIDGQHRLIADYLNRLADAKKKGDTAAIAEVFEQTSDYALFHFGFEESLLEEAGYDLLDTHRKAHNVFIVQVHALQLRFRAGEDCVEALHTLLASWLFNHIRKEDRAYVDAVKAYLGATHH